MKEKEQGWIKDGAGFGLTGPRQLRWGRSG